MRSSPSRTPVDVQREELRRRPVSQALEHPVIRLQRSAGNAAVTKLLRDNGKTTTAIPPQGGVDIAALAASINEGVIKQQLRTSRDSANESVRGGRWVGTVRGVEYALYEIDDVLFTHDDAVRIETMIRQAGEHEWPTGTVDPESLWRTVVQLKREGVSAADLLSLLHVYASGPTLGDWGRAWLSEAVSRLPQPPKRTPKAKGEPPPQPQSESQPQSEPQPQPEPQPQADAEPPAEKPKKVLSPEGKHLHRELLHRFAALTATSMDPMETMKKLQPAIAELTKRRRAYAKHECADFVPEELQALKEAIDLLKGLADSIQSLFVAGSFEKLLAFEPDDIAKAMGAANKAETAVVDALKVQEEILGEAAAATASAKGYQKPEKVVAVVKRKGGSDGVWDPGFTDGELAAWMEDVVDRGMNAGSVGICAREVVQHGGTAVDSTFGGQTVYHKSSGKKDSATGCTVFFTVAPDDVVTIVGIGWHVDPISYKLDWQLSSWTAGSIWINKTTIRLD